MLCTEWLLLFMLSQHIKLSLQEEVILSELPENILLINTIFCVWKGCRIYTFRSFMALLLPGLHLWCPCCSLSLSRETRLSTARVLPAPGPWSRFALERWPASSAGSHCSGEGSCAITANCRWINRPFPIVAEWWQIGNQRCRRGGGGNPNGAQLRQELQLRGPLCRQRLNSKY